MKTEKWQRIGDFVKALAENKTSVQVSVLEEALPALTQDAASFCRLCPTALPESVGFDINDDVFTPLGEALLELSPEVRKLRYELVRAGRLSENEFFSRLLNGFLKQFDVDKAEEEAPLNVAASAVTSRSPLCVAAAEERRGRQNGVNGKRLPIIEVLKAIAPNASWDSMTVSHFDDALSVLTKDATEFRKLCSNMLPESLGFDINDDKFTQLGQDLLDFSPAIRKLRYELVRHRRLSENEFFSRLVFGLLKQLCGEMSAENGQCILVGRGAPAAPKTPHGKWERVIQFLESLAPNNAAVQAPVIEQALTALTVNATEFCRFCPNLLPDSVGFDINDDRFTLLGEDLLELSPGIRQVRYELVRARRLNDSEFFSRLLCGLLAQLRIETAAERAADDSADLATDLRSPVCNAAVEESEEVEYTLLNIPRATAYQVKEAASDSGHASDQWTKVIWQGRCRVLGKGSRLSIELVDCRSDKLFVECIIPNADYEQSVKQVSDSSRCFLLKVANGLSDRKIGLSFRERSDASAFKACLSEFRVRLGASDGGKFQSPQTADEASTDYSMRKGETIKVNFKGKAGHSIRNGAAMQEDVNGFVPPPSSPWTVMVPPSPAGSSAVARQDEELNFEAGDFGDFQCAEVQQSNGTASVEDTPNATTGLKREEPQAEGAADSVQDATSVEDAPNAPTGLEKGEPQGEGAAESEQEDVPNAEGCLTLASSVGIQRLCLSLLAGTACVHKVPWPSASSCSTASSSLQWNIVVLGELTVDLQVHAIVRCPVSNDGCKEVVLQRKARGETFAGRLVPSRDRRLLTTTQASSNGVDTQSHQPATSCRHSCLHVDEIVFSFSNTFSWFNAKDVEIITLFENL